MKKIIIGILFLYFINMNIFAQITNNEEPLSYADSEYSELYRELLKIVKNEFHPPITGELKFIYNDYYGYGLHINPFTGLPAFYNSSFLECEENASVYSMTSGIVKDIVFDRMIIIEYNGIEIYYRDLVINNINIGDNIIIGQLLGKRKGADALHNFFNGIIIKIKYKKCFFDIGYIFNLLKEYEQYITGEDEN